ncbi:MAG: hypothetical protein LBD38_01155, partial [Streptococcaceae bacterium]|nr:hypothetical protein [Streptococcaceae bacterium]
MKEFMNSKPFYVLLSLVLALLLFFNANASSQRNSPGRPNETLFDETVHNVPVNIKVDTSKYYVSGYQEEVTVYLSSYNRILLDAEKNESTRSFSLEADLTKKKEGTYDVPVRFVGLESSVDGETEPETISVTIEKIKQKSFPVQVKIPDKFIQSGYSVNESVTDPATVRVETGEQTMSYIDHVEVVLPDEVNLTHDYSNMVELRAVDKEGQEISAITTPEKVNVSIKVLAPTKQVPVELVQSGKMPGGIKGYNF